MSNKARRQHNKELRKKAEEMPRPYSEGLWEEAMLENHSYWDIDILEKYNAPIRKKIKYWEEEFQPVNNMGKWFRSVRLQSLYKKLKHYEDGGDKSGTGE